MPFSQSSQISTIVQIIDRNKPASLLDVGMGMGQYGFLVRVTLEALNLFHIDGEKSRQTTKSEWKVKIDGIEGCEGYITPVHDYSYNNIIIGEALEVLSSIQNDSYDMIIAIDILEHFTKENGYEFLAELKRIASKSILISTPKEFVKQEFEENPYETHRSLWTQEALAEKGFKNIYDNPISWVAELIK